jgi:hypothetical protein
MVLGFKAPSRYGPLLPTMQIMTMPSAVERIKFSTLFVANARSKGDWSS